MKTYNLFVIPFEYEGWRDDGHLARAYYNWFISQVPNRIVELKKLSELDLDYSCESLNALATWFGSHIEIEARSAEETSAGEELPSFISKQKGRWTLSELAYSIAMDIGIYSSEVIRKRHNFMGWGMETKWKTYLYFRLPILTPDKRMEMRYLDFYGFNIVSNCALRIAGGDDPERVLIGVRTEWQRRFDLGEQALRALLRSDRPTSPDVLTGPDQFPLN